MIFTGSSGQYSRPKEDELAAILARAEVDLKLAQAGDEAAAERYRYRGIESVSVFEIPEDLIDALICRGRRITERIWRWSEVPLLGPIIASRLADQLDRLTDALDT